MLPLIAYGAAAATVTAAYSGKYQYANGFVDEWHAANEPSRPALVFVPGFLTEGRVLQRTDFPWHAPMLRYADQHDLSLLALHWRSSALRDLIVERDSPLMRTVAATANATPALVKALAALGLMKAVPPASAFAVAATASVLALRIGLPVGVLLAGLKQWRSAVAEADRVGDDPANWFAATSPLCDGAASRPLVFVGHSLGGRIVLRAAAVSSGLRVRRVVALAAAVERTKTDLAGVARQCNQPPVIFHSRNDTVLNLLFRLGERTTSHALGYNGSDDSSCRDVDFSLRQGSKVGHGTYSTIVEDCLEQALSADDLRSDR